MEKRFDVSGEGYNYLGSYRDSQCLHQGFKTCQKIDLGLSSEEYAYFKANGMDNDEDDGGAIPDTLNLIVA